MQNPMHVATSDGSTPPPAAVQEEHFSPPYAFRQEPVRLSTVSDFFTPQTMPNVNPMMVEAAANDGNNNEGWDDWEEWPSNNTGNIIEPPKLSEVNHAAWVSNNNKVEQQNKPFLLPPPPTVLLDNQRQEAHLRSMPVQSLLEQPELANANLLTNSSTLAPTYITPPKEFRSPPDEDSNKDSRQAHIHSNNDAVSLLNVPLPPPPPPLDFDNEAAPEQLAVCTLPNSERAQYLQTSHLSEQPDGESNVEVDSTMPPPGLSRLVVGEPNMHIEERQADGEDTSDDSVPTFPSSVAASVNVDRSRYMMTGESNITQPRVVTGLETTTHAPSTSIPASSSSSAQVNSVPNSRSINEQREIVLDGENLEDALPANSQKPPSSVGTLNMDSDVGATGLDAGDTKSIRDHHHSLTSHRTHLHAAPHHYQLTSSTGNEEIKSQHHTDAKHSRDEFVADGGGRRSDRHFPHTVDRESRGKKTHHTGSRHYERRDSLEYSHSDNDEPEYREPRRSGRANERRGTEYIDGRSSYRVRQATADSPPRNAPISTGRRSKGGEGARRTDDYSDYEDVERRPHRRSSGLSRRERPLHTPDTRGRRSEHDEIARRQRAERHRDPREFVDYRMYQYPANYYGYPYNYYWGNNYPPYPMPHSTPVAPAPATPLNKASNNNEQRNTPNANVVAPGSSRYSGVNSRRGSIGNSSLVNHDALNRYAQEYGRSWENLAGAYIAAEQALDYYDTRRSNISLSQSYQPGAANLLDATVTATAVQDTTSLRDYQLKSNVIVNPSANLARVPLSYAGSIPPTDVEPQRLTPQKFTTPRSLGTFAPGVLISLDPKYTSNGCLRNTFKILQLQLGDETGKLFKTFPGPLVRGVTHKQTIIEYCEEQIRQGLPRQPNIGAKKQVTMTNNRAQASYTLLWNLLILLLRQNGVVVGADIAELLLKNQHHFPYNLPETTQVVDGECLDETGDNNSDDNGEQKLLSSPDELKVGGLSDASQHVAGDNECITSASTLTNRQAADTELSETTITDKFRNYLLLGNVNEALEWASDNNLWGHALFLASNLDRRTHANIMIKFANKVAKNDPLQTLYQLLSGRTPSSVNSVHDESFGDWRPHLAMMISNTSQKPDLDRKAIATLGDSLASRGDIYGAHFCYLMAQVGFGQYKPHDHHAHGTAAQHKLVLLSSPHNRSFLEFANDKAIIMTEIYEYASSLNDDKFSIVEFQRYKFLLAIRMLDYGFNLKCLRYMEQIAKHIALCPSKYSTEFIEKIHTLADRIKFCEPSITLSSDDLTALPEEEERWLKDLQALIKPIQSSNDTTLSAMSNAEPMTSTEEQNSIQIDKQFAEINEKFQELNVQYETQNIEHGTQNLQPIVPEITAIVNNEEVNQSSRSADYAANNFHMNTRPTDENSYNEPTSFNATTSTAYYDISQMPSAAYHSPVPSQGAHSEIMDNTNAANTVYNSWNHPSIHQMQPQHTQQQQQQQTAIATANVTAATTTTNAPLPTISMPKRRAYDETEDTTKTSQQQQQQQGMSQGKTLKADGKTSESGKNPAAGATQSGWIFSGILNKLQWKQNNQVKLPDDGNPAIVWDEGKKAWVNHEHNDDAGVSNFTPPPKMGSSSAMATAPDTINNAAQQQYQPYQQHMQQQQPNEDQQQRNALKSPLMYAVAGPTATGNLSGPNTRSLATNESAGVGVGVGVGVGAGAAQPLTTPMQSNMFKMQRSRASKHAYIDVFHPAGTAQAQPVVYGLTNSAQTGSNGTELTNDEGQRE